MMDEPILWAFWGHEPRAFYKRRNGNRNTLFGNGEWIDTWYDRLHTEEAIARLAGMGVNTIYTHFYKAMGLEFERPEMENTAKIVEIAHKYGIKVIGYATINCVYDEAICCEYPELDSMRNIRCSGAKADNYREYLCLNSDYYKEYFPKVLKYGIEHVGLDGFHLDNAVAHPCYCERCLAGFRKFLEDNIPDPHSVGLPSFKYVRFPVIPLKRGTDAIALMAIRYYRSLYEKVFGGIFQYIKTLRPEDPPKVLINSGFVDTNASVDRIGFEIGLDMPYDYLFIETPDRFIDRRPDGSNKHVVLGYKWANMAGKKAFNTMWMTFGVPPTTPAAIKRVLFEGIVFGSIAGTNWAARSIKKGSQMIFDDEMQYSTIRDCFNFFKEHNDIYSGSLTKPDVRILYLPDTSRLAKANAYDKTFFLTADAIADSGIVYTIVRPSDIKEPFKGILVLPDAEYLSDKEVEQLTQLRANGVELLCLGNPGVYRDNGEERENWPFKDAKLIPLPKDDPESVAGFRKQLIDALPKSVKLNHPDLLVERAITADGREVVHILNPGNETSLKDLEVTVTDASGTLVQVISPDHPEVEYSVENGIIRIPVLDTLVTLIFEK